MSYPPPYDGARMKAMEVRETREAGGGGLPGGWQKKPSRPGDTRIS